MIQFILSKLCSDISLAKLPITPRVIYYRGTVLKYPTEGIIFLTYVSIPRFGYCVPLMYSYFLPIVEAPLLSVTRFFYLSVLLNDALFIILFIIYLRPELAVIVVWYFQKWRKKLIWPQSKAYLVWLNEQYSHANSHFFIIKLIHKIMRESTR